MVHNTKGGKISQGQVLSRAERHLERGLHFYDKKQYDNALTDLDEAIRLERRNPELYTTRGMILLDAGYTEEAQADFQQALKYDPTQWIVYYALGNQAFNDENYELAIQYFSTAQRTVPLRPELFVYKAAAFYFLREKQKAQAEIEAALQLTESGDKVGKMAKRWRTAIKKLS